MGGQAHAGSTSIILKRLRCCLITFIRFTAGRGQDFDRLWLHSPFFFRSFPDSRIIPTFIIIRFRLFPCPSLPVMLLVLHFHYCNSFSWCPFIICFVLISISVIFFSNYMYFLLQ